jgi:hypothetical protein
VGGPPDGALPPEEGCLVDLIRAIPYLVGPDIPPLSILNDVMARGKREAGMSGGALWEPFHIEPDEYRELIDELQRTGTHHGRFGWARYELPQPPASVTTYGEYVQWRSEGLTNRRERASQVVRERFDEAQRALDGALLTADTDAVSESQMNLWEAQQALAEYLIARWNVRLPGLQSRDELIELMQRAGEVQKRLWYAQGNEHASDSAALSAELLKAQRAVSRFFESVKNWG